MAGKTKDINEFAAEIASGEPRELPDKMKAKKAYAHNQNALAVERTELSKIRTDLAFTNSKLAVEQTHLSYLRTIVSLIGTGATLIKALPLFGISMAFTIGISTFLFLAAIYFIYKDVTTYPTMKKHLQKMENEASELAMKAESSTFKLNGDI